MGVFNAMTTSGAASVTRMAISPAAPARFIAS